MNAVIANTPFFTLFSDDDILIIHQASSRSFECPSGFDHIWRYQGSLTISEQPKGRLLSVVTELHDALIIEMDYMRI